MVIVSKDAIMRLRLAKVCCCSNMLSSPFLRIAGAGHWPAAWRETARTLGGEYCRTMTAILRKNEIGILSSPHLHGMQGKWRVWCPSRFPIVVNDFLFFNTRT